MSVAFNSRSGALKDDGWNHLMEPEDKHKYRRAGFWMGVGAALLGLLCFLLLVIILGFVSKESQPAVTQPSPPPINESLPHQCLQLQLSFSNALQRQEELLKESASLTKDRDAFRVQRDQLRLDTADLTKERDAFRAQRDQLTLDTASLTKERDAFRAERDQLRLDTANLTKERGALRAERDQLRLDTANLTKEMTLLQSRYDTAAAIRDELEREVEQATVNTTEKTCPQHWMNWKDKCYFVSVNGVSKTWRSSKRDCEEKGGHLVKIETREEQKFVTGFYDRTWIGLSDSEHEGTYVWTDGSPLVGRGFWQRNEPNDDDSTENCVEVSRGGGGWNDLSCSTSLSWVCERDI